MYSKLIFFYPILFLCIKIIDSGTNIQQMLVDAYIAYSLYIMSL